MKKFVLILSLTFISINVCIGQTIFSCDSIELKTVQQMKQAEKFVLTAADYVLSKPLHAKDSLVNEYTKFILTWMEKTPNYEFTFNEKIMDLCKDDENVLLFGVYTTCLAKAALEVKKDFVPNAVKLFVAYIKNPENQVKQTSQIKKLIDDFDSNKIDKYVK
jgi:hypothetical protein